MAGTGFERESERLQVLADLRILDTAPEREFDALAGLAKRLLGAKFALVSFIDADRQWIKADCGLGSSEAPRELSFCSVAVEADEPLILNDVSQDRSFSASPFVVGPPFIRFYAGIPVRARTAGRNSKPVAIGTLCVVDDKPRQISPDELTTLKDLACLVEALVEARAMALRAADLAEASHDAVMLIDRERQLLKQAERMTGMGSWRLTLADNHVEWSDGVFAIHELPVGEMPAVETALDFYPEEDRATISAALSRTIASGQTFDVETGFLTARGNPRRVRSMGELEWVRGEPVALVGVFQDITARYQMEQALLQVARTDELTQIANRAEFNRVFDERLAEAKAAGHDIAVVLIDLDGFKAVNDMYGHAAGDDVLRRVGARLRASYLRDCFPARLGGDEFALIVSSARDRGNLARIIERLLSDLRVTPGSVVEGARVSGTMGIAWSDGELRGRDEILQHADAALYSAKRTRKGTAQTFQEARCEFRASA